MSANLKLSASASGTRNTFDRTVNFVSTYGGASGGSQATNDTALSAFNTAYAAFSGHTQLVIPPGDYNFTGAVWAALGGSKLTITATGATLRNQGGYAFGGTANDDTHSAKIATVSTGASTVSLITAGQTSRFSSGQWVFVAGVDVQGFGEPPNPAVFEFKKIASIGTGTLTFTEPLVNSYKSTWPEYNPGDALHTPNGGPATVYALRTAWDQEIKLVGAYITDTSNLFYGGCRQAEYYDCTFETYGPCPTLNVLFRAVRCTTIGTELEVDKMVQRIEMIDCNWHAIVFQSSCINELYCTGTTVVQYWRGVAGGTTYINGLNCSDFGFGTWGYGAVKGHTQLVNCVASGTSDYLTSSRTLFSDLTEAGGGTLTYPTASGPPSWVVPGAYCILTDAANAWNSITFQITDASVSGGNTVISTTLPYPVPGTSGGKTSPWYIHAHPGPDVTCTNCSGSSLFTSQSALPAHSPLFGWTL